MTSLLKLDSLHFTSADLIPLLTSYQLIPHLLGEQILDRAIAEITCTPEETRQSLSQFSGYWGIQTEGEQQAWLERYGLTLSQLEFLATRSLRIQKFKEQEFGEQIESYFFKRKKYLDQVIYSLIRVPDEGMASELYFRLIEQEQSFATVAGEYSQGPEAMTGGLIGPVELGSLSQPLFNLLSSIRVGQVYYPICLGEYWVIVRLEKFISVQLDNAMFARLLEEKFDLWFRGELQKLSFEEKRWLGLN